MIFQTQTQSRIAPRLSASSVSVSISVAQTQTVSAGFMLGSRLPAPHRSGHGGFVSGFVAYRETVTIRVSIRASYSFSISSPPAWQQTKDPVRALSERIREGAAGTVLFQQSAAYQVTTVSMLYFSYVCSRASARPRDAVPFPKPMPAQAPRQLPAAPAAPSFKPVPQAANVPASAPLPASSVQSPEPPGAAVSLRPVEPSKTSDPFDWEKRSVEEMRYRYDIWNALGREKPPRVEVFSKASPQESKTVTPRDIDARGLSFSAVDVNGDEVRIPFSDVSRLRVLNA